MTAIQAIRDQELTLQRSYKELDGKIRRPEIVELLCALAVAKVRVKQHATQRKLLRRCESYLRELAILLCNQKRRTVTKRARINRLLRAIERLLK